MLRDGFGDLYFFHYDQAESMNTDMPINLSLSFRVPFYYNDFISTGVSANGSFVTQDIINIMGGLYFEYRTGKLSFLVQGGFSSTSIQKDLGNLKAAFPGDPGYFDGEEFYAPGTPVSLSLSSVTANALSKRPVLIIL